MDGSGFGEFLGSVASDPEMMRKIKEISESLSSSAGVEASPPPETSETLETSETPETAEAPAASSPALPAAVGDEKLANRTALIRAIIPYLSPSRREKAELLLKLLSLSGSNLLSGLGSLGGLAGLTGLAGLKDLI